MINPADSMELKKCWDYADSAVSERPIHEWQPGYEMPSLLIAEGFEKRSLGILQNLSRRAIRLPRILIGRYIRDDDLNKKYREQFEVLAQELAPNSWKVIENYDSGSWISNALKMIPEPRVALDITGLSSRGIFGAFDALSNATVDSTIMYSEAAEYFPNLEDWDRIKLELSVGFASAGDLVNRTNDSEWLYDRNFDVHLIPGHEGYDVAGTTALVAFLPFKSGRLAAVMNHAEYSEYIFIVGKPRLAENAWRSDALRQINGVATREWPVVEMSTFGYRDALKQIANLLFISTSVSHRCDIHIAPMGSKLQSIASWALSRITGAATMVTAVPSRYFPERYSDGIGASWFFPLLRPNLSANR